MQSDLNIYRLEEEVLLDFEPGFQQSVSERLDKYIVADDVQVMEVGSLYCLLPFMPLPVRFIFFIMTFIMTPLGVISSLFFLAIQVVYVKLLLDLRVAISERLGD